MENIVARSMSVLAVLVIAGCQTTGGPDTRSGEVVGPDRIRTELVGKILDLQLPSGAMTTMKLNTDGSSTLSGSVSDTGKWHLSDTGYCATWTNLRAGQERCATVRKEAARYVLLNPDGSLGGTIVSVRP